MVILQIDVLQGTSWWSCITDLFPITRREKSSTSFRVGLEKHATSGCSIVSLSFSKGSPALFGVWRHHRSRSTPGLSRAPRTSANSSAGVLPEIGAALRPRGMRQRYLLRRAPVLPGVASLEVAHDTSYSAPALESQERPFAATLAMVVQPLRLWP